LNPEKVFRRLDKPGEVYYEESDLHPPGDFGSLEKLGSAPGGKGAACPAKRVDRQTPGKLTARSASGKNGMRKPAAGRQSQIRNADNKGELQEAFPDFRWFP
jgi:hypothetical protein